MSLKNRQIQLKILTLVIVLLGLHESSKAQLNANFSADTLFGCNSIGVQFSDLSTGNITSWSWNFGNGNTSSLRNPFENYVVRGRFTVTLTVSDGINTDTEVKTGYIKVYQNPTADFSFNPKNGCPILNVNFTDNSSIGDTSIRTYIWDFGDGSQPGSQVNPTHAYSIGGSYVPNLQIIDEFGCGDAIRSLDTVKVTIPPTASFSATNQTVSCVAPYTVNFQNNSTGNNLSYNWDFGDGNFSTQISPSHTYVNFGVYDAELTVSDGNCTVRELKQNYVELAPINADFSKSKAIGCIDEPILFTDLSSGANTVTWNFGDGTPISFERNPVHRFQDTGTYIINFNASGTGCLDSKSDTIVIEMVIANFGTTPDTTCFLNDTVRFSDSSFNAAIYDWRIWAKGSFLQDTLYKFTVPNPVFNHKKRGSYKDTLIVTSPNGCKDTAINSRFIDPFETQILANDSLINYVGCLPFTLSFKDSSKGPGTPITWRWNFGNGNTFNQKTPPDQLFDTISFNNITLAVINDLGCTAYDTIEVIAAVKEDPSFSIFPDTLCQGDTLTIQMDSSNGSIYEFGIFSPASSAIVYREDVLNTGYFNFYRDTGIYFVNVTAGIGCDTMGIVDTFYVKGPMSFPYPSFNCGNPLDVQFFGDMRGVSRFYWDFGDGSPLDSVNINPNHIFPNGSRYTINLITLNDTNGCGPDTMAFNIDLIPRTKPNDLPFPKEYCKGDSIRIYFNNTLFYPSYDWYLNGSYLSSSLDSTISTDIFKTGTNEVMLVLTERPGCYDTVIVSVLVSNPKAGFTSDTRGGCLPYTVQFTDTSSFQAGIEKWEWFISSNPNDTLRDQNPRVTISQLGRFNVRLRITDTTGCTSDTTYVNYLNSAALKVDFASTSNLNICEDDTITFINRSTGLNINSTWYFGDGSSLTSNDQTTTHIYSNSGSFPVKLVAEDENGCKDSLIRYVVNVEEKPTAGFFADTTTARCYPLGVNFTDTSLGPINRWKWDLGDGEEIQLQDPFKNFTSPGNFDIQLIVETQNSCSDTALLNDYIQITGPVATILFDKDSACLNEPISFSIINQNGVDNFRWAFGDGSSSTSNPAIHQYTDTTGFITPSIRLTDSTGNCEVTVKGDSIYIENVISRFEVNDTIGCAPFDLQLTNLSQGQNNFVWDFGDGNSNSVDFNTNYIYNQAGNYTIQLTVNSDIGCQDVSQKSILVNPSPIASILPIDPICLGDTALLIASGGIEYNWFPNVFLSSNNLQQVKAFPDSSIRYSVEVKNQFDCYDTASIDLEVIPRPIWNTNIDTSLFIGEKLNVNYYAGFDGFNYSWTPTDWLSCSNCPNPNMQPLKSTTYTVSITDVNGCFDTSYQVRIEVKEVYSLDVPTAFSPNNDGKNDIIFAKGWGLKELIAFKIYNRFGELVFESNDFDKGWDGKYKGVPQNIETYVYTVEALTIGEEVISKKGNISLLR